MLIRAERPFKMQPSDQNNDFITDADKSLSKLHLGFVFAARGAAIAALILCAVWASRADFSFLTVPSWKTNLFAWHPVLMVCGFFFSQIFAVTSWGVGATMVNLHNRVFHVFWQMAACATLSAGLVAIFQTVDTDEEGLSSTLIDSLTSMHSWLGISAAGMFFFNLSFKAICYLIPTSDNVPSFHPFSFRNVAIYLHRMMGHAALILTAAAIGAGIMEFHGDGGCDATITIPAAKVTAAERYSALPDGCKISNGIGIAVIAAVLCTNAAMGVRYLYLGMNAARAAAEVAASQQGVEASQEFKEKVYLAMTGTPLSMEQEKAAAGGSSVQKEVVASTAEESKIGAESGGL